MSSKVEQLRAQLNERILVLDGGMGTMIESYRLNEADFRGGTLCRLAVRSQRQQRPAGAQ
ncbi:hypothetical protein ACLB1Q_19290 [Escherichia coli]